MPSEGGGMKKRPTGNNFLLGMQIVQCFYT